MNKQTKNNHLFHVVDNSPIVLSGGFTLPTGALLNSISSVNTKFQELEKRSEEMALNIFEALDFRMLSGLLGETLVTAISQEIDGLEKNPNIDGYPDLLNVSEDKFFKDFKEWKGGDFAKFIKYPYGGIEIKNTFGTKKAGAVLHPGEKRISKINNKPDWKAHHGYTNHLLAILSDFVEGCPQIVAALYSDRLNGADWTEKQNPKKGSTMTSFCVIKHSGWEKLLSGIKICRDEPEYLGYFGVSND